jgi:hypothetical protein
MSILQSVVTVTQLELHDIFFLLKQERGDLPVQESFSNSNNNHGKHYCVTEVCGLDVKCVEKHQ